MMYSYPVRSKHHFHLRPPHAPLQNRDIGGKHGHSNSSKVDNSHMFALELMILGPFAAGFQGNASTTYPYCPQLLPAYQSHIVIGEAQPALRRTMTDDPCTLPARRQPLAMLPVVVCCSEPIVSDAN